MEHSATYSPEDNKLRLYPACRLDADDYAKVKAARFKWAPKQELFVAPSWTPGREDLLLEMCGEIGDEDYSPEERAADRAERFSDYRDRRLAEAGGMADSFDAGPSAFGHQNRQRAERQAVRHDRLRVGAVSQWSKAEYWQRRTAGVISSALYKSSAPVRRSRIKRLEAEQRKHLKGIAEATSRYQAWQKVAAEPDGATALRWAMALANTSCGWLDFKHPRTGRESYLYSLLTDEADPITGHEAAALYLAKFTEPALPGSYSARWSSHYDLRLTYERAMIGEEGGTAGEVAIEPGGWFRFNRSPWQLRGAGGVWLQIQKVNKSPATGCVTSIGVLAPTSNDYDRKGNPFGPDNPRPMVLHTLSIEREGEGSYRAPTDEERAAFAAQKKASKAAPVSTINPTDEDAERLQQYLNRLAEESAKAAKRPPAEPRSVERITQAHFSRHSGHDGIFSVKTFEVGGATN